MTALAARCAPSPCRCDDRRVPPPTTGALTAPAVALACHRQGHEPKLLGAWGRGGGSVCGGALFVR